MNKCIGCAKCCYSKLPKYKVLIDSSEIDKYEDNYFIEDGLYFLKIKIFNNYRACIFLDTEKMICSIYDKRPRVCREFEVNGNFCKQLIKEKD